MKKKGTQIQEGLISIPENPNVDYRSLFFNSLGQLCKVDDSGIVTVIEQNPKRIFTHSKSLLIISGITDVYSEFTKGLSQEGTNLDFNYGSTDGHIKSNSATEVHIRIHAHFHMTRGFLDVTIGIKHYGISPVTLTEIPLHVTSEGQDVSISMVTKLEVGAAIAGIIKLDRAGLSRDIEMDYCTFEVKQWD